MDSTTSIVGVGFEGNFHTDNVARLGDKQIEWIRDVPEPLID